MIEKKEEKGEHRRESDPGKPEPKIMLYHLL